jgi:hypothetical protein
VLLIGDPAAPHWPGIRQAVEAGAPGSQVRHAPTLAGAVQLAEAGWHPELIVVGQEWTHQYTHTDILTFPRVFPLARLVCCYGPWCGSDGRSGTPWPAAVRVPAGETVARIQREFEVLNGGRGALPLTASRDEIFAFDHSA